MTLDQLKPGSRCRIRKPACGDKLGQRLMDMGTPPGLRPLVVRTA